MSDGREMFLDYAWTELKSYNMIVIGIFLVL